MDLDLIYGNVATIEDLLVLAKLGFEFEINDGEIKGVIKHE